MTCVQVLTLPLGPRQVTWTLYICLCFLILKKEMLMLIPPSWDVISIKGDNMVILDTGLGV